MLVSAACATAVVVLYPGFFSAVLLAISLLRVFAMFRILHGRMHDRYMRIASRRTVGILVAAQVVVVAVWQLWHLNPSHWTAVWVALGVLQCAVALMLLSATIRRLRHTAWPATDRRYSDAELPTVTIAIPARNETEDLQLCLESIIASDYPKLEVIVLDDCSQTRRTPEIIRGFAHDGVRFIRGEEPSEIWLPKNQAYNRLASEASGAYILFCGVDIRLDPGALRSMVSVMLQRKKAMLSVLPDRAPEVRNRFSPAQAMRYFWELVPPRRLFGKPPVLSSCWMVTKDALHRNGGFEAVRRSITPEAYFARQLAVSDEYSFMRAGDVLGVVSMKGLAEQRDTAMRIRYPQLHRRPESVGMVSAAEILFLIAPFVLAIGGYWFGIGLIPTLLAALASLLLAITNALVAQATHLSNSALGFITLPYITAYDLVLMYYSMWRYEFSVVDWKGRNICVPAMHVIPRLPKIE